MYSNYNAFLLRVKATGFAIASVTTIQKDAGIRINRELAKRYLMPLLTGRSWTLSVDELPTEGHTVFDGEETFTFAATPSATRDVAIGSTAAEAARNLRSALNSYSYTVSATISGTTLTLATHQLGTPCNDLVPAVSASMTLTETTATAPSNRFSMLEPLEDRLTQALLIRGQNDSGVETDSTSFAEQLMKDALAELAGYVTEPGTLLDDDGNEPSYRTDGGMTSDCYEEAEEWQE